MSLSSIADAANGRRAPVAASAVPEPGDGSLVPVDLARLATLIEEACADLAGVSAEAVLTIQGRASRSEQQAYQGLPVTGTIVGDFRIDPETFLGPVDIMSSYSEVHCVTVTLDHSFNAVWSANVKARWSESAFEKNSQSLINEDFTGGTPLIPPSTWAIGSIQLFIARSSLSASKKKSGSRKMRPVTGNDRMADGKYRVG